MQKTISFLTVLAMAIFMLACSQDSPADKTDAVEAPSIEKGALTPETNMPGEKEVEISVEALPDVIKSAIQATYAGAELLEADQITRPDGSIYYDVEINHNDQKIELMYESDGSFLGIEEDDGDDDGE